MDRVVLLHALGRTRRSMRRLDGALRREGFETRNLAYPSFAAPVPALGERVADRIRDAWPDGSGTGAGAPTLHLVGHSMGGILIRWMLAHRPPPRLGRVVLIAAPNKGSRLADFTAPWLTWLIRPLPDLTTDPDNVANRIVTPPGAVIGIIAGSWDYTVPVERAGLASATDMVIAHSGHMFLPDMREVQALTARFLKTGRFAAE